MGNVQDGGHAPQGDIDSIPNLTIEASKLRDSLATLCTRANLTRNLSFIAALDKNEAVFARCLSLKHGQGSDSKDGFLSIHWAVLNSWVEGVRLALDSGIPVDSLSLAGYTPLHIASYVGSVDCARLLINSGASVTVKTRKGATPLGIAAQQGQDTKDVLEFLLQRGASPTMHGYKNRNALETAIFARADIDVIQTLLAAGAKPCAHNPHMLNLTPVHLAALMLNCDVARVLLQAGGDPNALAERNAAPLILCYSRQGMQLHFSDTTTPSEILEEKRRAMFTVLCDAGADVGATMGSGSLTVLHVAFGSCKEEASINQILDSPSCDPSKSINAIISPHKLTMLQIAARNGWVNATRKLATTSGVDLEIKNKEGFNALHLAVISQARGAAANKNSATVAETVTAILEAGADPHFLAPDVFPNYKRWRVRQGMVAARAVLVGGPVAEENLPEYLRGLDNRVTALDTAVLITQDIGAIEAFLKFGVLPSAEALAVGEQCVPILRSVIKRTPWTPEMHKTLPKAFKSAAKELVLSLRRAARGSDGQMLVLSEDIMRVILTQALYPISNWTDAEWIHSQRVKKPHEVERSNQKGAAAAAVAAGFGNIDGDGMGGGIGPQGQFLNQEGAMADDLMQAMPEVMGHAMNFIQQQQGGNAMGGNAGGDGIGAAAVVAVAAAMGIDHNNPNIGAIPVPMHMMFHGGGGAANAAMNEMFAQGAPHYMMQMQMHLPGGHVMMMGGGPGHDILQNDVDDEEDDLDGIFIGHHPQIFDHHDPGGGDGLAGLHGLLEAAANQAVEAVHAAAVGQGPIPGPLAPGEEGDMQVMQWQIDINMDDLMNFNSNNNDNDGNNNQAGGGGGGLMNHPVLQHAMHQHQQQQMQQQVNQQLPAAVLPAPTAPSAEDGDA
ncbi:hypothetical protein Ndes2437B_g07927 [Nannochloris sp. 'desiccata']